MSTATPTLWIDRLGPYRGSALALAAALAIGWADYQTGYAIRLSLLQLAPVALVAWTAGIGMGIGFSLLCALIWLVSFEETHPYAHDVYFAWEALIILGGYLAVAVLVSRLRHVLHDADERFSRLVEGLQVAVAVVDDTTGAIAYRNPAMVRLVASLGHLAERDLLAGILAVLRSGDGAGVSSHPITGAEPPRWLTIRSGDIPWTRGQSRRLLVLTDITDQHNAAYFRERHREAVHESARLATLAEIAATLAHEINQPLMTIATYTDACQRLLESGKTDREQISTALQRCHAQAVRASSIIERLRDFVRDRRGRLAPCGALELTREATALVEGLLDERRIPLRLKLPATEIVLDADRHLVVQALLNLLRNAVDALLDGGRADPAITLELGFDAGSVSWRVRDNGPGIPPGQEDSVFAPFQTTRPQGLGLGLSISRSIAESHGGSLVLERIEPPGACFVLTLPRRTQKS